MTFNSLPTYIRKVASFICPRLRLDFVTRVQAHPHAVDVSWDKRPLQSSHMCLICSIPGSHAVPLPARPWKIQSSFL